MEKLAMRPKVRFKEVDGEWKRIKFSAISSRITRRNSALECKLPLTISASEGLISQEKFFNNIVASSNLSNYYLIRQGEFAYNKSYSNGYPFGAIKRLDKYDSGVLSPLYICFSIDDEADSDYICTFFETTLWHKDIAERATEGARNHGILNIGTEDFFDIDITLPEEKAEQQAIASFFRSIDAKLQASAKKVEALKKLKSASLISMFPQNGESTPKVRFKGFEEEWKIKSFDELYKHSSIKNDLSFDSSKIISLANMYFKDEDKNTNEDYLLTYNIMKLGDIAFEGHKSKSFAHGRFVENDIGDGIVSHVFVVFSPKSETYDISFWKYYINNESIMRHKLIRCTKSSTMMNDLVVNEFLKESILVPSLEEQQKIGSFFRSLDRKISLETARLEKLKQIKLACLDKMFV